NSKATQIDVAGPESAPNIIQESPDPLYETQLKSRGKALPDLAIAGATDADIPEFKLDTSKRSIAKHESHPVQIVNGYFVIDGRVLTGGMVHEGWWRGQVT